MNKIAIIFSLLLISFSLFLVFGCSQSPSTTTTSSSTTSTAISTSTTTSTSTTISTTTTTSSTTTTIFSSLSGQVKVPASLITSGLRSYADDGISDTPLSDAILIITDANGVQIPGTVAVTTDANGNYTINNVPTNLPFYLKVTKEAEGEIYLLKDLVSMESTNVTGETINAKSSLVAQRIDSILSSTSLTSFEAMHDLSPADSAKLLDFEIGSLSQIPDLKAASESQVESNLITTYNTITAESITFEAIDNSVDAQLLVSAASNSNEYLRASWRFFDACGFAVPTIESLGLMGHGPRTSAMPFVPEDVLNTMAEYLQQGYRWSIPRILIALNQVASWEVHYTVSPEASSQAIHIPLLPAQLTENGGNIVQLGINNTSTYYDVITTTYTPSVEEGAFGVLLYGTIPSYEGYIAQIRSLERPSSPSWETPSLIDVATLAFPASYWNINPNIPGSVTFNQNTQLNILQAYAMIYYRQLKIQGFNTVLEPPYYNHQIRLQLADRPSLEAELLQHLFDSKL